MGNEPKRRNRNETKRKTYEPKRTRTGKNRNEKKRKTTETKRNGTGKNQERKTTGTTQTGTETNRSIPETKRNETPTPRTGMNRKRNEPKPQEPKRNETKRYHPEISGIGGIQRNLEVQRNHPQTCASLAKLANFAKLAESAKFLVTRRVQGCQAEILIPSLGHNAHRARSCLYWTVFVARSWFSRTFYVLFTHISRPF